MITKSDLDRVDADLSFDDIEDLHDLLDDSPSSGRDMTSGECLRARDMHDAGDTKAEIASFLSVDQRELTPHLLGLCDCRSGGDDR